MLTVVEPCISLQILETLATLQTVDTFSTAAQTSPNSPPAFNRIRGQAACLLRCVIFSVEWTRTQTMILLLTTSEILQTVGTFARLSPGPPPFS